MVKTTSEERISERSQVIEVPKISCRGSAEVVKTVRQERVSERMGKQRRVAKERSPFIFVTM